MSASDPHRAPLAPEPPPLRVGERFGPYLLTEQLGMGGMAVVYKARLQGPHGFEKDVVVKVLRGSLRESREFVDLFIGEARTTALLTHPGIVQVYDFGLRDATPYLVMEYLDGVTLSQLMRALEQERGALPVDLAVVLVTQVCHALGHAHRFLDRDGTRRQIIHGDVSLSNVMVCRDGSARLLDFGVATVLDEFDFELSDTLKGKLAYMAPEQIDRQPFDRRVDVFAAGIVLHELLTGRRLFAAPTAAETLQAIRSTDPPPPSRFNPAVTPALDAIVARALARDPGARFDSALEMATALERASQVEGGRRRTAELVRTLFPREARPICQVCGKPVVPGTVCRECDSEAPRDTTTLAAPVAVAPPAVAAPFSSPEPAPVAVAAPLPPTPARKPRPRSITELVAPLPVPPPRRPSRARTPLGLVAVALLAFALGGGLALVERAARRPWPPAAASRASTPPPASTPPASTLPRAPTPTPPTTTITVVEHPAPPIADAVAAAPRPPAHPATRHAPAHARTPAGAAAPGPEPPSAPSVRDGRLLDPFAPAVE